MDATTPPPSAQAKNREEHPQYIQLPPSRTGELCVDELQTAISQDPLAVLQYINDLERAQKQLRRNVANLNRVIQRTKNSMDNFMASYAKLVRANETSQEQCLVRRPSVLGENVDDTENREIRTDVRMEGDGVSQDSHEERVSGELYFGSRHRNSNYLRQEDSSDFEDWSGEESESKIAGHDEENYYYEEDFEEVPPSPPSPSLISSSQPR